MGENQSLEPVFAAIKAFGGYFVFKDNEGTEYVIQRKDQREAAPEPQDVQLTFTSLTSGPTEDDSDSFEEDVAAINRTLAALSLDSQNTTQVPEDQEEPIESDLSSESAEIPPPRRVRFEPLRGDLPPELQE